MYEYGMRTVPSFCFQCPPNSGSLYYNYKGFFSIVLLAVADANYRFRYVDVGGYGSEGDAGLFQRSSFGKRLDSATLPYADGGMDIPRDNYLPGTNISAPHVFLGDDAFPLKRHLLKPYRRNTAAGHEETFNYRLSRARRVVENAFGILSTRWRALESKMNVDVELSETVVAACVVLHNYLKSTDSVDYTEPRYVPLHYVDYENEDGDLILGDWRSNVGDHAYASTPLEVKDKPSRLHYSVREKYKTYFTSDDGSIPWQNDVVKRGQY